MENRSRFCTCADHDCPLHPANHADGCSPCIQKNLKRREIPNCFFNLVAGSESRSGHSLEVFARLIMQADKGEP